MKPITRKQRDALIDFIGRDPKGIMSALINTIDTHTEYRMPSVLPIQAHREWWTIRLLLEHDNLEHSTLED